MRKEYYKLSTGRQAAVRAELKSLPHKNTTQSPAHKRVERPPQPRGDRAKAAQSQIVWVWLMLTVNLFTKATINQRQILRSNAALRRLVTRGATG